MQGRAWREVRATTEESRQSRIVWRPSNDALQAGWGMGAASSAPQPRSRQQGRLQA